MSCAKMTGGRRRSRKMRGGNGYGIGQPISVGALEYVPNMTSVPDGAAYKPMGGRRRHTRRHRRSRRRGGADNEASAPPMGDDDLVPRSQCTDEDRKWVAAGVKAPNGEALGRCRGTTGWSNVGPSGKQKHHWPGARRRSRHTRRRRSMRGGGSVAGVGYGFTGEGARGLANQSAYSSNLQPSGDFAIPTGTR